MSSYISILIQFDIFQNLDGLMEITEQGVQPQKSDQRKVAQHFIQWMSAKFSSNKVGTAKALVAELLGTLILVNIIV